VGDNEVLYSDAARLHRRMTAAKVSVRMDHYEGMWHVFQMSPLKKAYAAMDRIAEFIFDICR
jgi:acetyl esterase/lipase